MKIWSPNLNNLTHIFGFLLYVFGFLFVVFYFLVVGFVFIIYILCILIINFGFLVFIFGLLVLHFGFLILALNYQELWVGTDGGMVFGISRAGENTPLLQMRVRGVGATGYVSR